jgi:hypothetical protein
MTGQAMNGDPIGHLKGRLDALEKKVTVLRPRPLKWNIDKEVLELKESYAELDSRLAWIERQLKGE